MSKIANKPIRIVEGVEVKIESGRVVTRGVKGELFFNLPRLIDVRVEGDGLVVLRKNNTKTAKSLQGTTSRVLENNIRGVNEGWSKTLELIGTGYRARLDGKTLVMAIGFSHPVKIEPEEAILFEVSDTKIKVSGVDRGFVGAIAAKIRKVRPPDPYKGKGIRYEGESIKTKPGKTVGATGAAGGAS